MGLSRSGTVKLVLLLVNGGQPTFRSGRLIQTQEACWGAGMRDAECGEGDKQVADRCVDGFTTTTDKLRSFPFICRKFEFKHRDCLNGLDMR